MILERLFEEQFLRDHFGGQLSPLEPLAGGHWSQAFAFRHKDKDLVVRFGAFSEDFRKDRLAAGFSSAALPIPEVLEIGPAPNGYFCISERVFGEMLDGLDAHRMERIIPAVLGALDALREADYERWEAAAGEPPVSWAEQLLSVDEENDRVFGWHDRLAASPIGMGPYNEALEYLRAHADACPEVRHLVHNDLLHFNVLVQGDQIAGVIDWGNAIGGDFLHDLALFSFYAPWYPAMANIDWAGEAKRHYREIGLEVLDFEGRLRCCEVHLGLEGMAYNAFTRNWDQVEANARRTRSRLRSARGG